MNRRTMLLGTAAIPAAVAVASCSSTGGLDQNLMTLVTAIQQGVAKTCGFLVSVSGVIALIGGINPVVSGVAAAIAAICSSIPPTASRALRAGQPAVLVVKGVTIDGVYLQ